jgi:hypothetical protein
MGFISNPRAYDQIKIGGMLLPGEVHLGGEVMRMLAKRHKRGSGDDGGSPVFRGLMPCDFTILLQLHTDADEDAWAKMAPVLLDLNQSGNRNQFSIEHPQLKRLGITRVIVHGLGEAPPIAGAPIKVTLKCSSVKDKPGGTHTPKATRYAIAGKIQTPYRPGLPLTLNDYNKLTLNARSVTALQQARIDNGIPIDLVRPDGLAQ